MRNTLQVLAALALVALLVAVLDPFMLLMPPPVALLALVLAAALAAAFAGFVFTEGARDEREEAHRRDSGRAAYLAGLAVLTCALLMQGLLEHHVDPWIAAALSTMVVAKVAARLWSDARR